MNDRPQILILEDDAAFRALLQGAAERLGEVTAVAEMSSALQALTERSYRLLLLDWYLVGPDLPSFQANLDSFQPGALQVALFTVPELAPVVAAMKSGAREVLWAGLSSMELKERLSACLAGTPEDVLDRALVPKLVETLAERALIQGSSLFKARKEFSKLFLTRLMNDQKVGRARLAGLMDISTRTLHRHMAP